MHKLTLTVDARLAGSTDPGARGLVYGHQDDQGSASEHAAEAAERAASASESSVTPPVWPEIPPVWPEIPPAGAEAEE